jgi:hypothetical protein
MEAVQTRFSMIGSASVQHDRFGIGSASGGRRA